MGWIENAAAQFIEFDPQPAITITAFELEIQKIIREEYEKEFPPVPVKIAFQAPPSPTCIHCGSAAVRNSSMHPQMWTCNDCGKHTQQ